MPSSLRRKARRRPTLSELNKSTQREERLGARKMGKFLPNLHTMKTTMKNIESEIPATVSARKSYRPPTPISVALVTKVALELGRTEDGTYSHTRFETLIPDFEKDIQRTTELLQGCQSVLKAQLEELQ
jgi:hypothetical protein